MPMIYVPFVVAASDGAASSFDISKVMTDAVTSVQGDLLKVLAIAVAAAAVIYGAVAMDNGKNRIVVTDLWRSCRCQIRLEMAEVSGQSVKTE